MELDKSVLSVSPVLEGGKKNIMIDIDGTICDDVPNEEPERMATATEYPGARETINAWYEDGHTITFFTSRSSSEHKEVTVKWLNDHGFKYHALLMDKPRGGNYHWIDNHFVKGVKYSGDWGAVKSNTEA
ncbi:MAG: LNS2 domain-containing protein [Bacteroidia bacterium]